MSANALRFFACILAIAITTIPARAIAQRLSIKGATQSAEKNAEKNAAKDPQKKNDPPKQDLSSQNPFAVRANRFNREEEPQRPAPILEVGNAGEQNPPEIATRPAGAARDAIFMRDGDVIEGEILAFSVVNGISVLVDGQTRAIPLGVALRIEFETSDALKRGIDALEAGRRSALDSEYRRALAAFQEARANASRRVEKELATARIVETLMALGRSDAAVVEFFLLCRIEPYTPYLSSIPLQWLNSRGIDRVNDSESMRRAEEEAAKWLVDNNGSNARQNVVARLLAASTLMRSARYRNQAANALQELCACEPPDDANPEVVEQSRLVALLAIAQRWRDETLKTPRAELVDQWQRTLELVPNELKPGPAYLIALSAKANGDLESARKFFAIAALSFDRAVVDAAETELKK